MPLTSCQAKSITPIDPALGQAFDAAIMVAPPTVAIVPSVLAPPPHRTTSISTHFCAIETWRSNGISIKTQTPNIFRRDIYTNPAQATFSLSLSLSFDCLLCGFGLGRCQELAINFNLKLSAKAHWEKPTHTTETRMVHGALSLFGWQKCCFWLIMASSRHGTALLARSGQLANTWHATLICICACAYACAYEYLQDPKSDKKKGKHGLP